MWDKIKGWFKRSLTIFLARVSYILGLLGSALIATFSGYDFTQLAALDWTAVFKMLGTMAVLGILTELARRRTLPKNKGPDSDEDPQ